MVGGRRNFPFSARYRVERYSHIPLCCTTMQQEIRRNRNGQPRSIPTGASTSSDGHEQRKEKRRHTQTCLPFLMVALETKQIQIILLEPAGWGVFLILSCLLISLFKKVPPEFHDIKKIFDCTCICKKHDTSINLTVIHLIRILLDELNDWAKL